MLSPGDGQDEAKEENQLEEEFQLQEGFIPGILLNHISHKQIFYVGKKLSKDLRIRMIKTTICNPFNFYPPYEQ